MIFPWEYRGFAAALLDPSSNSRSCSSGFRPPLESRHVPDMESRRNRRRHERHQLRMQQKQAEARQLKRRMLWNKVQREQRIAEAAHMDQQQLPHIMAPAQSGYVRIGNVKE